MKTVLISLLFCHLFTRCLKEREGNSWHTMSPWSLLCCAVRVLHSDSKVPLRSRLLSCCLLSFGPLGSCLGVGLLNDTDVIPISSTL